MSRLIVNGQPVQYRLDPRTPLLFALREASNLTGAKYGCGTGHCGACTVHVDGQAVRSCQVAIADCEGSQVTTIEGLAENRAHPVQQAFLAANLVQCGFCIPGMVMAAAALVDRAQGPADSEIDAALTNICRCGIYPRLREALRNALQSRGGPVRPAAPAAAESEPAPAQPPVPGAQPGDEIVTPTE